MKKLEGDCTCTHCGNFKDIPVDGELFCFDCQHYVFASEKNMLFWKEEYVPKSEKENSA